MLDDVADKPAEDRFGLLFGKLVVLRQTRGEMLQCHGRRGCFTSRHVSLLIKRVASKAPLTAKQLNDSVAADHAILPIPPMFSASRPYLVRLCGKDKARENSVFSPQIFDWGGGQL